MELLPVCLDIVLLAWVLAGLKSFSDRLWRKTHELRREARDE